MQTALSETLCPYHTKIADGLVTSTRGPTSETNTSGVGPVRYPDERWRRRAEEATLERWRAESDHD
jgi:hypothetical protein